MDLGRVERRPDGRHTFDPRSTARSGLDLYHHQVGSACHILAGLFVGLYRAYGLEADKN